MSKTICFLKKSSFFLLLFLSLNSCLFQKKKEPIVIYPIKYSTHPTPQVFIGKTFKVHYSCTYSKEEIRYNHPRNDFHSYLILIGTNSTDTIQAVLPSSTILNNLEIKENNVIQLKAVHMRSDETSHCFPGYPQFSKYNIPLKAYPTLILDKFIKIE